MAFASEMSTTTDMPRLITSCLTEIASGVGYVKCTRDIRLKPHLSPLDIVDTTLFLASDTRRVTTSRLMAVIGGIVMMG